MQNPENCVSARYKIKLLLLGKIDHSFDKSFLRFIKGGIVKFGLIRPCSGCVANASRNSGLYWVFIIRRRNDCRKNDFIKLEFVCAVENNFGSYKGMISLTNLDNQYIHHLTYQEQNYKLNLE